MAKLWAGAETRGLRSVLPIARKLRVKVKFYHIFLFVRYIISSNLLIVIFSNVICISALLYENSSSALIVNQPGISTRKESQKVRIWTYIVLFSVVLYFQNL
jgi:hypothetical protein